MVREKLTRKTPDRNAVSGTNFIMVDRVDKRFQNVLVFKKPRQRFLKNFMIDRIKIFANVPFKIKTTRSRMS